VLALGRGLAHLPTQPAKQGNRLRRRHSRLTHLPWRWSVTKPTRS
jgi:hypothetical protein